MKPSILQIPVFPLLVAIGVLTAQIAMIRRARRLSLNVAWANRLAMAAVAGGFLGAHLGKFLYEPALLAADPVLPLRANIGISSFGGILGGVAGAFLIHRSGRLDAAEAGRYWDLLGYAFPFGWLWGRAGCAVVHDHPGLRSQGWFTHGFPDGRRYDLGLIELVGFALPISAMFLWLGRRGRDKTPFAALFLTVYGLFRLALDQLHDGPPKLGPFTVDQAGAAVTLTLAACMWHSVFRTKEDSARRG